MNNNPNCFSELEDIVPKTAYGEAFTIYMVAYEAWRRGLNVSLENVYSSTEYRNHIHYRVFDNENDESFTWERPLSMPKSTLRIISSKSKTRRILTKEDVPTVKSKVLNTTDPDLITSRLEGFLFPLRISSIDSPEHNEVNYIVSDFQEIKTIIKEKKEEFKSNKMLIEESLSHEHCHAYIVNGEVVGAYRNVPLYIKGDGKKSVNELLKEINELLNKIPSDRQFTIRINKEIEEILNQQNHSLNSVLKKGEIIFLDKEDEKNFSVDITDNLPSNLKNDLIKVISLIPNLSQGEVEFIYDEEYDKYKIYAINTQVNLKKYLYPIEGSARFIPKAIIDYYFPETQEKYLSDDTPKFYFDYEIIEDEIQNARLSKAVIPQYPYEPNLVAKLITFTSSYDGIKEIIKSNFFKLNINGEFNVINENQFELILAGNYQDVAYFHDFLKSQPYFENIEFKDHHFGVRVGYSFNGLPIPKSNVLNTTENQNIEDQEITSSLKTNYNNNNLRKTPKTIKNIIEKIKNKF
ncbi:hypothetical protein [Salinicoccus kekensis]|uniref:D-alanine-D-alanine ligase-like ATP-grasp enzyme n=1 Tax=Salinicoccus kekensis TaxID=714307 RepID=A0A285UH40_9STAP|nr:hypothetical protein [Salinicoccus kekensis]SOC41200.1 D-alanine-D-alanine ligase-like ATP-grasp enzyme [Salinicoccus kekensis]